MEIRTEKIGSQMMKVGKFADSDWAYAYMPMQEDWDETGFVAQIMLRYMTDGRFSENWSPKHSIVAPWLTMELPDVIDFLSSSNEYSALWKPGYPILSKEDMRRRFHERCHPDYTINVDSAMYTYLLRNGDNRLHERDILIFCYKKETLEKHSEKYFRGQAKRVKMWKEENEQNSSGKKPAAKIVPAISSKRSGSISWDEYFMGVAALSAMRSKDPHTQVGCCIVGAKNRIASVGYNGFPFGCDDDEYPWNRHSEGLSENETKYPYVVHSELNAILNYRGEVYFIISFL